MCEYICNITSSAPSSAIFLPYMSVLEHNMSPHTPGSCIRRLIGSVCPNKSASDTPWIAVGHFAQQPESLGSVGSHL